MVFAFAGPLIGALIVLVVSFAMLAGKPAAATNPSPTIGETAVVFWYLLLFSIPFGYIFGTIPALLTGLAVAACDGRQSPSQLRFVRAIVIGTIITFAVSWLTGSFGSVGTDGAAASLPSKSWQLTLTGGITSAICERLTRSWS